jgi:hypothetical protein
MSAKPKPAPAAKKAAAILTGEQLDQIKKKDVANQIRKVKEGRALTASERKILERAAGEESIEGDLVSTTRLAEIFQINRKTVAEWRKERRAGIPAKVGNREPLSQWRSWFAANPSAGHYDGKPRLDRETLLCEKLEVEIAIKKIEHDRATGDLIPLSLVRENMTRITSAARAELLKLISDLPPRVAGMDEIGIAGAVKELVYEILDNLSNDMHEYYSAPSN